MQRFEYGAIGLSSTAALCIDTLYPPSKRPRLMTSAQAVALKNMHPFHL